MPQLTEQFAQDAGTMFLFSTNDQCALVNADFVNSTNSESQLFQWPAMNTGTARRAKLHDVKMLRRSAVFAPRACV